MIIDLKIVTKKFLDPTNLIKVQNLCIYELLKAFMVNENKDLIFAAF